MKSANLYTNPSSSDSRIDVSEFEFIGDAKQGYHEEEMDKETRDPYSFLTIGLVFLTVALTLVTTAGLVLPFHPDEKILLTNYGLVILGFVVLAYGRRH